MTLLALLLPIIEILSQAIRVTYKHAPISVVIPFQEHDPRSLADIGLKRQTTHQ